MRLSWHLLRSLLFTILGALACYSANAGLEAAAILQSRCLKCHGEAKTSGLDLRSRESALRGGEHGPVIIPGDAEKSKLYRLVAGIDSPRMPADGTLTAAEIQAIREWINAEANGWPDTPRYWAFVPPRQATPPRLARNPVDAFLLRSMREKGLKPAPLADRRTLVRRAYLDLIGLPPSPAEVTEFLRDRSPEAWEHLIDRLLASPHYGERWGRHWLDVARYADSNGFEYDFDRPNAWRYRDWVVRTLNQDLPYDEFLREQIAGDEIDHVTNDSLTATGFLRMYTKVGYREKANPQFRFDYLDDMIATIGRGILGLTIQCARCHNHKFDPIPQTDYYRLQASLFGYVEIDHPLTSPEDQKAYEEASQKFKLQTESLRKRLDEITKPYSDTVLAKKYQEYPEYIRIALNTPESKRTAGQMLLAVQVQKTAFAPNNEVEKLMKPGELAERKKIQDELQHLYQSEPQPPPSAMAVTDGDYRCAPDGPGDEDAPGKGDIRAGAECSFLFHGPGRYQAPESHLLLRGDINRPGPAMQPGFLTVTSSWNPPVELPPADGRTSGRRRALAEWLVSRQNPLTARVAVNRIWHHHFGRGIVPTLDNFGKMGEPPSHPELLDWLAVEFMNHGWSMKYMHRLIMTSEAYRRGGGPADARNASIDPDDVYLWGYRPQRLEAEALRDSILAVSGGLDPDLGGPPVFPELPDEILGSMRNGRWDKQEDGPGVWRRSIYVYRKRGLPFPMFEAFDLPDQNSTCDRRNVSSVPTQALILMNDKFVLKQAALFAERIKDQETDPARQIDLAYEIALSRPPASRERALALEFLKHEKLEALTHVLLNLNEFVYR